MTKDDQTLLDNMFKDKFGMNVLNDIQSEYRKDSGNNVLYILRKEGIIGENRKFIEYYWKIDSLRWVGWSRIIKQRLRTMY